MSRKRYYGLVQAKRARKAMASNSYGISPATGYPQPPRITGASLAANVFGVYGGDECMSIDDCSEYESSFNSDDLVPDGEYQLEFDLFNQEEIEDDLRATIRRYEEALEKMGTFALKWHWLQEDIEKYGQIEKMFKDMQVCRRLCGGGDPSDLQDYQDRL